MKCKFCFGEIEENTKVCPHCAQPLEEETEQEEPTEITAEEPEAAKKPMVDARLAWAAVALCAVLLAVLMCIVVSGLNTESPGETTAPTQAVQTEPTVTTTPPAGADQMLELPAIGDKASYTVSTDVLQAAADTVVATMGSQTLTVEQLQVFYWMQYIDFMNYYGYYASFMGLDSTKPLDQQYFPDSSVTWEQYFLDGAIGTWKRYTALSLEAEKAGFQLAQELQDSLAGMPDALQQAASEDGYASVEEMITLEMGPGCTVDAYVNYTRLYYLGVSYFNSLYEQLDPSEDEIKAYFAEHAEEYTSQGITADTAPYVDVRHILLMPTGGTADASGNVTYSDAEWEACLNEAQTVLDTWAAGEATEDSFAQLANQHSKDGGSNTTGGLYTNVTDDGTYVEAFTAWCMDETRQAGDTGIVKTEYGYHIMYFVRSQEAWYLYARDGLISEQSSQILSRIQDENPMDLTMELLQVGAIPEATTAG